MNPQKSKYIYVKDGRDAKMQVQKQLADSNFIRSAGIFNIIASQDSLLFTDELHEIEVEVLNRIQRNNINDVIFGKCSW